MPPKKFSELEDKMDPERLSKVRERAAQLLEEMAGTSDAQTKETTLSLLAYANGKLGEGTSVLATHPGRIKERLTVAFQRSLAQVPAVDLPAGAKTLWDEVWEQVTAIKGTKESGPFAPSIDALDEYRASQIAEKIVSIQALIDVATIEGQFQQ